MTESLDDVLARAGEAAWSAARSSAPIEVSRRVRSRSLLAPMVILGGLLAAAALLVGSRLVDHSRSVPTDAVTPIDNAEAKLTEDLTAAAGLEGWTVAAGESYSTTDVGGPGRFVEVRLLDEAGGVLMASIRLHDPSAVQAGTAGRESGLIRSTSDADIYLGTDSKSATAVELFTADTIVYVRSESRTYRSPDQLANIAVVIANQWAVDPGLPFDQTPTARTVVGG